MPNFASGLRKEKKAMNRKINPIRISSCDLERWKVQNMFFLATFAKTSGPESSYRWLLDILVAQIPPMPDAAHSTFATVNIASFCAAAWKICQTLMGQPPKNALLLALVHLNFRYYYFVDAKSFRLLISL